MAINDYGVHTIDNLINVLQEYKKILGGDTKVYLQILNIMENKLNLKSHK